ncbi:tyrosine-type recombinase/integrase [Muricoccus aerilatus]|uniref:tyrosine-type recombinase/integrase n=1 Tax=Muricoccus aerilatus TaxID=452982 RepID=UPI000693812A|nr:tyrosine-type recombinase/integrase [Roseomonas aerilata]
MVVLRAAPVVVANHLVSLASTLGRSGLRRRLAAIAHHHRQAGHPWETRQPAISATIRGIPAAYGNRTRPAALTSAEVKRLLASCRTDMAGLRDRALLLVGFGGALRRSELAGMDREHLCFVAEGMTVLIPRSKHD